MIAFAILADRLCQVEVEPATSRGGAGKHRVIAGDLPAGRLIVLGERWQTTAAAAWEREAQRLDAEGDRWGQQERMARGMVVECGKRAQAAMAAARAARRRG